MVCRYGAHDDLDLSVVEALKISFIASYSLIQMHVTNTEGTVLEDSYEHGQKQSYSPKVYTLGNGTWKTVTILSARCGRRLSKGN